MIKSIHIKNFKSLQDVRLNLGKLNFIIGANASGKSNFFDALRFLQGAGNGFSLNEIVEGKPKSATAEVWDGIRGGREKIAFVGNKTDPVELKVEIKDKSGGAKEWSLAFDPVSMRVMQEALEGVYQLGKKDIDGRGQVEVLSDTNGKGQSKSIEINRQRPALTQVLGNIKRLREYDYRYGKSLANMQRIDPSPMILRDYSKASSIQRIGERGENFAVLVKELIGEESTKEAYLSWLRHLRPSEIDDVKILKGAVGESMFCLVENGHEFPAPVLSDGTLRFAAITAALFQPDMPHVMTIEEIENGIHASRLCLMVELLRSRAEDGATQLFVTTHSPVVLAWLLESEYAHTFYCKRDEKTGASRITPLNEIPRFDEIIENQSIIDLFAEGWLEDAL